MSTAITITITADNSASEQVIAASASLDALQASADATSASLGVLDDASATLADSSAAAADSLAATDEALAGTADAAGAAAEAVTTLGAATEELAASAEAAGVSLEGLNSTTETLTSGGGLFALMGIAAVGEVGSKLNEVGTEAFRTSVALDTLSHGKADEYLKAMQASTHGMVDEMTLAHSASLALSSGVATSADQMAELARIGTVLGDTFQGSAATGIETVVRDLEMVGSTRGLKQLGIDAAEVKAEFERLKSEGVDAQTAWTTAFMDVAGKGATALGDAIMTGPVSAMDKLNARISDFKDKVGNIFATAVNGILDPQTNTDLTPKKIQEIQAGTLEPIYDPMSGAIMGYVESNPSAVPGVVPTSPSGSAGAQPAGQAPDYSLAIQNASKLGIPPAGIDPFTWMIMQQQAAAEPQVSAGQGSVQAGTGGRRSDYLALLQQGQVDTGEGSPELTQAPALAAQQQFRDALPGMWQLVDNIKTSVQATGDAYEKMLAPILANVAAQTALQDAERQAEVGGTGAFDKGIASARQALITKDQSTWKGKQGEAGDLATFDKDAQYAQDQYMLATGQATQASLTYRDAQKSLTDQLAAGKISLTDYEKGMLGLADASAHGTSALTDLLKAQDALIIGGGTSTTTAAKGQAQKEDALLGMGKGSGGASSADLTELQSTESIAKALAAESGQSQTNLANIATAVSQLDATPLKTASDHAGALQSNALLAYQNLGIMVDKVNLLKSGGGQYTFTFQYVQAGGNPNTRNIPGGP